MDNIPDTSMGKTNGVISICLAEPYQHRTRAGSNLRFEDYYSNPYSDCYSPNLDNECACFQAELKKKPNNNKAMIETGIS